MVGAFHGLASAAVAHTAALSSSGRRLAEPVGNAILSRVERVAGQVSAA
jgi:hypothetical protein